MVSEDERESGVRAILNYGHTIGHGLEAATGYQGFLHGEAVAVGMMGAARISQRMACSKSPMLSDSAALSRALVCRRGLPAWIWTGCAPPWPSTRRCRTRNSAGCS